MSKESTFLLTVVKHKLRKRIIDLLDEHDELTSSDIRCKSKLEQLVISQHLAILRRCGIVLMQRKGEINRFSIDRQRLNEISHLLEV